MSVREYSGNAKTTKLNGAISNTDTALVLVDGTGYPTGATGPFVLTIDATLAGEEKILCVSRSGNNVTATTRGYDGTTASGHDNQATVQHTISAVDLREANAHVNASSAVHGLAGAVVGTTDAQTLTNKTLTTPTIGSLTNAQHDHSNAAGGSKLAQANTHQTPDTDAATTSLHHTLGTGANQAAAGNHTHGAGSEEAWHTVGSGGSEPAFSGSWSNVGSGFQTLQYKKVGNEVRIRGVVNGAAGTVFTLPAGYRPPAATDIPVTSEFANSPIYAQVLTTGALAVTASNASFISFSTQFWID